MRTRENGAGAPIVTRMRKERQQYQPMKTRGFQGNTADQTNSRRYFPRVTLRTSHKWELLRWAGTPCTRMKGFAPFNPSGAVLIHYVSFAGGAGSTHNTRYAKSSVKYG